jgi:hypothetical protein
MKIDRSSFDSIAWSDGINLKYNQKDFAMKLEESSLPTISTENYMCPNETSKEYTFSSLLPKFSDEFVSMSNIPIHVDNKSLGNHLTEKITDCIVELSHPNADKNYYRLGWLSLPEKSESKLAEIVPKLEALGSIEGAKIYFGLVSSNFRRFKVTNYPEGTEKELYQSALNFVHVLESNNNFALEDSDDYSSLLDKTVIYLRQVHNYCFFCALKFGCCKEMTEKCGDLHLRNPIPHSSEQDKHDHRRFIEKLDALLEFLKSFNEISETPSEYASLDDFLTDSFIKKVDEGKFRCESCAKAFKGPDFVLKHLHLKHEDLVKQTEQDLASFLEFLGFAQLWMFPSAIIPRYMKVRASKSLSRSGNSSSRDSNGSNSKSYTDWDAAVPKETIDISYDL